MVYHQQQLTPNWLTLDQEAFDRFNKEVIGLENWFGRLIPELEYNKSTGNFPPYNIEKIGDRKWQITVAVAGFDTADLHVEVENKILHVTGDKNPPGSEDPGPGPGGREYLHRGIAERAFTLRFSLTDYVEVNGLEHQNGLLVIDLEEEIPEEKKSKTFEIKAK